jgi:hypothetical protein
MKNLRILSRKFVEIYILKMIIISRENEANKRKLQQMQVKVDESQNKEQGTLAKLQECIQIVEQNQFEKNEVKFFDY